MMFDPYSYLCSRLGQINESGHDIKRVVRISGLSQLEELTADVRGNAYPCVAVDMGADGNLDFSAGTCDTTFNSVYVLIDLEAQSTAEQQYEVLQRAKQIGLTIIRTLISDSHELSAPCYGLKSDHITYSCFGPIGLQCYGYVFNFVISNDNY